MKSLKEVAKSILLKPVHIFDELQLKSKIRKTSGDLNIIIGAHNTNYENWLPSNIENLNLLHQSAFQHLFGEKKVDRFLAEHVFEHITYEDALIALKNCNLYMKKGGTIRIAVPDGFHPNPDYINMVKPGGFGEGAHDHKLLYDYKSLSKILVTAGFEARPLEYYDEQGEFHFTEWDSKDGHIHRSKRYDKRFNEPLGYSSLIVEGIKI